MYTITAIASAAPPANITNTSNATPPAGWTMRTGRHHPTVLGERDDRQRAPPGVPQLTDQQDRQHEHVAAQWLGDLHDHGAQHGYSRCDERDHQRRTAGGHYLAFAWTCEGWVGCDVSERLR